MWNSSNPAELYAGTTWELISQDKYIKAGNTPLQTGGNNSIVIQKANLPNVKLKVDSFFVTTQPHVHKCTPNSSNSDSGGGKIAEGGDAQENGISFNTNSGGGQNTGTASPSTENLGIGTSITIQPSYITLKFWKRLS